MMKDTRSFDRRAFVRAAVTLILALCLCLSILPMVPVSADTQEDALSKLVSWGVMNGYPDGSLRPNNAITRAEFVALVNRAYGYKETGNMPFLDVPYNAWYYDDISIAYNARYFDGTSTTTASPQANLTREQAMTLLARGMRLDSIPGEVTEFSDGRSFSTWSRGYVKAAYRKGLIGGYSDGSFKPLRNITRGEMALLLSRALGTLVHERGEHTLGSVYGNVTINTPGTTLYDTTIVGDLYITGGLGLGSVVLDNVRVLGSIIVAGGGESEAGQDSIVLRNVRADELKIDSLAGQYLSLRAEGDTVVTQTNVRTDCYIQDRTQAGQGLLGITLEGANGNYTLAGNLETVVNKAPGSSLKIARGTLGSLTIDETASGSKLTIESDATVKQVNLDTAVNVTGGGDVGELNVNTAGSSTSMLPDDINIRPGITADVYGETMDTTLGQESSSAPRILAGYPKASDVAPTTMTATVATNKSGTLYWAVSAITDGSVGEEGLLSPAAYGSKAVKYGTIQVGKSNTDLTISVTGLTVGGNYYFSAMLVDARNDRSPVKVISFSTPDNTVPAFASGYPALVDNSYNKDPAYANSAKKYYADFTVKSTKSCNLYWVVYTKGSTAPSAAEFRSGSLAGAVAYNRGDKVERNADFTVHVDLLSELTDYDIYFWLNDFDNTKSSAVKKLTFKTVDGTPPVFVLTPTAGQPSSTGVKLTTTVNENATVYWVAVAADAEYPVRLDKNSTVALTDLEYAIFQVENGILGSDGVKSGKVAAKANTEATISITGLAKETAYDIWFVAKDTAGNYSLFNTRYDATDENFQYGAAKDPNIPPSYVRVNTLDTTKPTATREFAKTDKSPVPRPYPDSTISLIFSEDVQRYSYIGDEDYGYTLLSCRDGKAEDMDAKLKEFFLRPNSLNEVVLTLHCLDNENEDFDGWYEKDEDGNIAKDADGYPIPNKDLTFTVRLDNDGKRVIVDIKGVQLKSGTWYEFELNDLCDISNAKNQMGSMYKLEQFQTVSSKVKLNTLYLGQLDPTATIDNRKDGYTQVTDDPIQIDMAFTFTPDATSTDSSARDWDMVFWSDTSVDFVIYRRFHPADSTKVYPGVDMREAEGWVRLPGMLSTSNSRTGVVSYTVDSDMGRVGKPLHHEFDNTGASSYIAAMHPLNELPDDGSYYEYAIHFIKVNGKGTRTDWDETVKFQINVVAGTSVPVYISGRTTLLEDAYNGYLNQADFDLEEIEESQQQSKVFTLSKQFDDTSPPQFADESPYFIRKDTSLTMQVNLKRAGTVFWVATPVGSSVDSNNQYHGLAGTTDAEATETNNKQFELETFYVAGRYTETGTDKNDVRKANITKAVEDTDDTIYPAEAGETILSGPDRALITSPTNDTKSDPKIKIGSTRVDEYGAPIEITDLDPSTGYFIYVVVRGSTADSYSPMYLYKVATKPSDRPVVMLGSPSNAVVSITTVDRNEVTMTSSGNYVIMRNNSDALNASAITGPNTNGLGAPLTEYVENDAALKTQLNTAYPNMTLLESMDAFEYNNGHPTGTVFDIYVRQEIKERVYSFIQTNTSGVESYLIDRGTFEITTSGSKPVTSVSVDCNDKFDLDLEYIFLAVATNTLGTERGFSALYPVVKQDDSPPAISDCRPYLGMNGTTLTGSIILTFDRDLYFLEKSSNTNVINRIYASDSEYNNDDVNAVKIDDIKTSVTPDNTSIAFDKPNSLVGRTITLNVNFSTVTFRSTSITFSNNLCNALGKNTPTNYVVEIELSTQGSEYFATVKYTERNADGTYSTKTLDPINVSPLTVSDPDDVPEGTTVALSALKGSKVVPATWSSDNTNVATVNPTTGVVTGVKAGTATIRATTADGLTATCVVTVTPPAPTLTLNQTSMTMAVGGTQTLTATPKPASTGVKVDWSTSDGKIATVSTTGIVRAINSGTVTITAKATVNGKKVSAECKVTVTRPTLTLPNELPVPAILDGKAILTLTTDLDPSLISDVNWSFTPSNQSTFTTDHDGGPQTQVEVIYRVGGNSNVKIQAKITTVDGAEFTSNSCTLTLTK